MRTIATAAAPTPLVRARRVGCAAARRPAVAVAAALPESLFVVGNSTLRLAQDGGACVRATLEGGEALTLHWGLVVEGSPAWLLPPSDAWPADSRAHKGRAVQTPLSPGAPALLPLLPSTGALEFVLIDAAGRWLQPSPKTSFRLPLAGGPAGGPAKAAAPSPTAQLPVADPLRMSAEARGAPAPFLHERELALGGGARGLLRVSPAADGAAAVCLVLQAAAAGGAAARRPAALHWAVAEAAGARWAAPPPGWRTVPPESEGSADGVSWDTRLEELGNGLFSATVELRGAPGFVCALRMEDGGWLKEEGGGDIFVRLAPEEARRPQPQPQQQAQQQAQQPQQARPQAAGGGAATPVYPLQRASRLPEALRNHGGALSGEPAFSQRLLEAVCSGEAGAQRSLMHRYNMASELLEQAEGEGQPGLAVVYAWMRFAATRQLILNKQYNIKPREVSAAQERLVALLCRLHRERAEHRDLVRLTMCTVGRGGSGDMGQRIRDEILDVQQRSGAKGGFMEEWHQKLHNNTTPDDVAICAALLAYLRSPGLDVGAFWASLAAEGLTRETLAGFERALRSEPRFDPGQVPGLIRDLTEYQRTLKAVHSGADLASASDAVLGYSQASSQGVAITHPPLPGVATPRLAELLRATAAAGGAAAAAAAAGRHADAAAALLHSLGAAVEARCDLRPWTRGGGAAAGGREREVLYLDLALEAHVRTACESCLASLRARDGASLAQLHAVAGLALESLALGCGGNGELLLCLRELQAHPPPAQPDAHWALRAKALCDRLSLALAAQGARAGDSLQPAAAALGGALGCEPRSVAAFSEEVVRSGAAAPLAQLLGLLAPRLRELAHLGGWQVVSPAAAAGRLRLVDSLAELQGARLEEATVLYALHVGGEEDIPEGATGVLTPSAPDLLSHVAVRARNERLLFATLFDQAEMERLRAMQGQWVSCRPAPGGQSVTVEAVAEGDSAAAHAPGAAAAGPPPRIVPRPFTGVWAVPSTGFEPQLVGGKSRNLQPLRAPGALPPRVSLPRAAALTFGCFSQTLAAPQNAAAAARLRALLPAAAGGEEEALAAVRACVATLTPPPALRLELEAALSAASIPLADWEAGWAATLRVWASKWNSRALSACAKARLEHEQLAVAVLVQPVQAARYAFVLHTVHPLSRDPGQLYGELVLGLGETLVGAHPGRALSFSAAKAGGEAVLLGYPSKPAGLFARGDPGLIFRSDSNGEDLEGFAGAGLYDSIMTNPPALEALDYADEPLLGDAAFRAELLGRIAAAGVACERALGAPQDVEGCVLEDGEIVIVQTRPQVSLSD